MSFSFSLPKATEAACLFLEREGGTMNILKLVKLVYLLDRLAVERVGVPVAGGTCFSMRNGPVNSALLDLINAGSLGDEKDDEWERYITDRRAPSEAAPETKGAASLALRSAARE